ncbi:MAG: hypothetical protein V3S44_08535, partial [Alphaproteobacteria bacterium]
MSRWKSLKTLRAAVARIERGDTGAARRALPLGVAAIDAALGEGGLCRAALHEIFGAAADGFAALLAGRLAARDGGAVLWCVARRGGGDLYPPALWAFGLDPSRLVLVRCRGRAGMLSAMEEGLRCSGLAAVLGEADRLPDMIAGRRLQLAAEEGGVTGFLLLHGAMSRGAMSRGAMSRDAMSSDAMSRDTMSRDASR